MKKTILFFFIIALLTYGCKSIRSNENSVYTDSKATLAELLGEDVAFEKTGDSIVISYCPDNTCESFYSTTPASSTELIDFSYIYLFYVSEYYALEEFKKTGKKNVSGIVDRYSNYCPSKEIEKAKCVLRNLADTYNIEVKFIRYDEKQRNEVPVDLEAELNRLKSK